VKNQTQDAMRLTVLPPKLFRPRRYRAGNLATWSGHLPFANDLIAALRPSLLVELGVHYGESYFGMCQSVQENGVSCACYAVDTWAGDPHAGYYDESVFDDVNRYNEENYAPFSKLLRTTFDEAREKFGDNTIDLLHIDGLHRYEAVSHDFHHWYDKVRAGGVILLHDTAARHLDFQVWRLWEELTREFAHIEFTHSWGLGVLRKPGPVGQAEFVDAIFSASPADREFLRHYYSSQGQLIERQPFTVASGKVFFQVFPSLTDGYRESNSSAAPINVGDWQQVRLDLPQGSPTGPIRIDPADRPCVIELAGMALRRAVDGTVLKSWTHNSEPSPFVSVSDLLTLPADQGFRFLSIGKDPHFSLPELDSAMTDQPLVFEARVRIDEDLASAAALFQSGAKNDVAVAGLHSQLQAAVAARDRELVRVQQLSAEIRNLQAERVAAASEYRRVHAVNEALLRREEHWAADEEQWRAERAALKAELDVVYHSRSWWLTAPLRALLRAIR
jgi:hypothetical protein